MDYRCEDH